MSGHSWKLFYHRVNLFEFISTGHQMKVKKNIKTETLRKRSYRMGLQRKGLIYSQDPFSVRKIKHPYLLQRLYYQPSWNNHLFKFSLICYSLRNSWPLYWLHCVEIIVQSVGKKSFFALLFQINPKFREIPLQMGKCVTPASVYLDNR